MFVYPLPTWNITSGYGDRIHPITKVLKFHNGIDISTPIDTPLISPEAAIVEKVYANTLGGKQIVLAHPGGYKTGYAHLNSIIVSAGDSLKQGDIFGYSGNTGASTGPHLHFTTRKDNKFINPESLTYTKFKKKSSFAIAALIPVLIIAYLILSKK